LGSRVRVLANKILCIIKIIILKRHKKKNCAPYSRFKIIYFNCIVGHSVGWCLFYALSLGVLPEPRGTCAIRGALQTAWATRRYNKFHARRHWLRVCYPMRIVCNFSYNNVHAEKSRRMASAARLYNNNDAHKIRRFYVLCSIL